VGINQRWQARADTINQSDASWGYKAFGFVTLSVGDLTGSTQIFVEGAAGYNSVSGGQMTAEERAAAATEGLATAFMWSRGARPKGEVWVNPAKLRFSQTTAGGPAANPRTPAIRQSMKRWGWLRSKGPVDVVRTSEGLVTLDNTRVAIAQELGIPRITARIHHPGTKLPQGLAHTRLWDINAKRCRLPCPETWGDALRVRTRLNKLPYTGTANRPRLRERP
jgi:hypothetical protein